MARKTPVDKMAEAVGKILTEYEDDIGHNLDIITQKMGPEGVKAVRASARRVLKKHTGEYTKGWTYGYRQTRRSSKTTIYNEHYSLPHLLEHSHVTDNGTGRTYPDTPGHPHIAPVAEALTETFEREVLEKL